MKVLFVFAVVALALVHAAPSGWGGWNGGWGGGWAGHGAVAGPVAAKAVVAGPSGVIASKQSNPGAVVVSPGVWGGWSGGHGWNSGWNGAWNGAWDGAWNEGHGWSGGHGGW